MTRKILLILTGCLLVPLGLSAQSNALIDEVLSQTTLKTGHGAYLVLTGSGLQAEDTTIEQAATQLFSLNWGISQRPADASLTLGEFSLMLMKAFEVPGGIGYSIFGGPRYAVKELRFLGLIDPPVWADKPITGSDAMRLLFQVMELKEPQ